MAPADDKLIDDSALDFSQRLHTELPLRHYGEFHDQEQLTKVVEVIKNNVFRKAFNKIWPREKEEIASLFKKLNRLMDKLIAEWVTGNREHEIQSISFLQKWVDSLCENFNEALEHQLLLNPDMEMESLKHYIEKSSQNATNVFESIWKPGTAQMQSERKSKLEKHLKAKEEEMLEKQKHHLETKSVDEGKKLLREVGSVLLERSRQLKSYVDKHQERVSSSILKGMVEEMLEYILNGKGSLLRKTHEEIYDKLVETLEGEVKFLNEDPKEKVASYAERFDAKLQSYCIATEEGSEDSQEIQEQDPQLRMTLQEILNECVEERSSEPSVGTKEEASDNIDNGEIHGDDDEVMVMHNNMENDARTSTAVGKRISRRRQFAKGGDSSSNDALLPTTAAAVEKTGGVHHHHRESARLQESRKSVQSTSSGGSGRKKISSDFYSSRASANLDKKDVLHPISDVGGMQTQLSFNCKSVSTEQSRKRKQDKRNDNDEMEESLAKRKQPREDISKTKKIAGDQCPIRRSARSRNSSKKATAAILRSRKTREPKIKTKMTEDDKEFPLEDYGDNQDDNGELQVSSRSSEQASSSKASGKMMKGCQVGEHACPSKITLLQGNQPKYQCSVCKRKFRLRDSYLLKYHGDFCNEKNWPHSCTECGKGFIRRQDLTHHIRIHTGEKPVKCPKCPAGFKQSGELTRHIRIHTGEKPYKCTECPLRFSRHGNLKRHFRAHERGATFTCEPCNVHFVSRRAFYNHNLTHKERLPIVCIYCKRRFAGIFHLKKHVIVHSGERPFQCPSPTCAYSSTTKYNLVGHLERVHGHPGKVAMKIANDAALDYLIRETNKQSFRDIPQAKLNSAVVEYVIKNANLQLPGGKSVENADSTNEDE